MSGYLRRLVERHVVEPTARPRALSRFETGVFRPRETAGEAAVPPLVESPPTPLADRIEPPKEKAASPAAPRFRQEEGLPPLAAQPESRLSPAAEAPTRRAAEPPRFDRPLPSPLPIAAATRDVPPPDRGPGLDVKTRAVATVMPRSAPRVATAPPPARRPVRAASLAAPREPDVVRVQIGRVEVRAVHLPAERPAPLPPSRPAEGPLSLERYLARRGRP